MSPPKKKAARRARPGIRGERMREARIAQNLTHMFAMPVVRLYPNVQSDIELEKKDTTGAVVRRIAIGFQCSTDWLLGRSDSMKVRKPSRKKPGAPSGSPWAGRRDGPALIGERVREVRKLRGLSLMDVYEKSSIRPASLSQIENEKKDVMARHIVELADLLDCSTDYWFGLSDSMDRAR